MQVIGSINQLKDALREYRRQGKSIGFVPTMGYLHEGHLSLMRQAKAEKDVVVVSIFVNPLQFGANEDYGVYPRDLDRDVDLANGAGVDIVFAPSVKEMYPHGFENMVTYVDVRKVTERLCGASRPGHFRGVATVVTKLFNIVQPDTAYFGQKDAQQVVVIKRMVEDLNIDVEIVALPIVREADGLALSSRNVFLNAEQRKEAVVLYKSLLLAQDMLRSGEKRADEIKAAMRGLIGGRRLASIDYIEIVDLNNLEPLTVVDTKALIALAVRFGGTRLIDNMIWEGQ